MKATPKKRSPSDYKAIALWGRVLCSFAYYIKAEQERACAESAPIDAIYKDSAGVWQRISDLPATHRIRVHYEKEVAK